MSLPPLTVPTTPSVPLPSLVSLRQNATESFQQARPALERWHKAASVPGATWQSAGSGAGPWT